MLTEIRFPTEAHRDVVNEILADMTTRSEVCGVLLGGSLARGTARSDSDIDLFVVTAAGPDDLPDYRAGHPLAIDLLIRTAGQWRQHFNPDRVGDESWGYAFIEAVVLHDPDNVAADLVAAARDIHAQYRTPVPIKAHYSTLWQHVRPKMLAVRHRADPVEIGWAAAVMTNDLLRTAWAVNDLPNPSLDLGTVQRHLDDLTTPPGIADQIRTILRSSPQEALRHQLDLLRALEPHLTS